MVPDQLRRLAPRQARQAANQRHALALQKFGRRAVSGHP
jgi:hypothetical protein